MPYQTNSKDEKFCVQNSSSREELRDHEYASPVNNDVKGNQFLDTLDYITDYCASACRPRPALSVIEEELSSRMQANTNNEQQEFELQERQNSFQSSSYMSKPVQKENIFRGITNLNRNAMKSSITHQMKKECKHSLPSRHILEDTRVKMRNTPLEQMQRLVHPHKKCQLTENNVPSICSKSQESTLQQPQTQQQLQEPTRSMQDQEPYYQNRLNHAQQNVSSAELPESSHGNSDQENINSLPPVFSSPDIFALNKRMLFESFNNARMAYSLATNTTLQTVYFSSTEDVLQELDLINSVIHSHMNT